MPALAAFPTRIRHHAKEHLRRCERVAARAMPAGDLNAVVQRHVVQRAPSQSGKKLAGQAHRTQAGELHANLLAGLPNCARIGFTGTPIIMGDKKRTHEIFGEFIDRYTIKEAEADGATVPVLYEGRPI